MNEIVFLSCLSGVPDIPASNVRQDGGLVAVPARELHQTEVRCYLYLLGDVSFTSRIPELTLLTSHETGSISLAVLNILFYSHNTLGIQSYFSFAENPAIPEISSFNKAPVSDFTEKILIYF